MKISFTLVLLWVNTARVHWKYSPWLRGWCLSFWKRTKWIFWAIPIRKYAVSYGISATMQLLPLILAPNHPRDRISLGVTVSSLKSKLRCSAWSLVATVHSDALYKRASTRFPLPQIPWLLSAWISQESTPRIFCFIKGWLNMVLIKSNRFSKASRWCEQWTRFVRGSSSYIVKSLEACNQYWSLLSKICIHLYFVWPK